MSSLRELMLPGAYTTSKPYIGFKCLKDTELYGGDTLFAEVHIPSGATIVCLNQASIVLMRTNTYTIAKIVDCAGKSVKFGFGPIFRMKHELGKTYTEPNLNCDPREFYVRGLHFYPEQDTVIREVLLDACQQQNYTAINYWQARSKDIREAKALVESFRFHSQVIRCTPISYDSMIANGANGWDSGLGSACYSDDRECVDLMIRGPPSEHGSGCIYYE